MAEPFIGEIRLFTYNFIPDGWLACEGQILNINQYQPLFTVIGSRYGGDGQTTFKLPDLRNQVPIHQGQGSGLTNRMIASSGGEVSVTLTGDHIPSHNHTVSCIGIPDAASMTTNPANGVWTNVNTKLYVAPNSNDTEMAFAAIGSAGAITPQAHSNLQPYLVLMFGIAWNGMFPVNPG